MGHGRADEAADEARGEAGGELASLVSGMDRRVQHHLRRARSAAGAGPARARAPLAAAARPRGSARIVRRERSVTLDVRDKPRNS